VGGRRSGGGVEVGGEERRDEAVDGGSGVGVDAEEDREGDVGAVGGCPAATISGVGKKRIVGQNDWKKATVIIIIIIIGRVEQV